MKIGIQLGCFDACLDVRCCIHGLPLILESACREDEVLLRDPYGGALAKTDPEGEVRGKNGEVLGRIDPDL